MEFDSPKFGKQISARKDLSADIRDIADGEVESVLKNVPGLSKDSLKEKVRFVAEEFVCFDFKCKDASLVIQSKARA